MEANKDQKPAPVLEASPEALQKTPTRDDELYKPKTLKFWLVLLSTFTSMFLVALDRTIIATAVPRITDDFKSQGDIGWYGSAYMLTTAACQLVFGRIYSFYDLKWTFLASIVLFEIGSAVCGAAPSSVVFIVGRAIAGLGSAGIMTGAIMSIIPLVPLHKRPMFQSLFGMVFGVASVAGPLIGGAFTQHATWRWCFYMNLPIGVVAFVFLYIFEFPKTKLMDLPQRKKLLRLDPVGTTIFIPTIVSLLLALQWGGSTYSWNSWRIIVLFVCFAIGAVAFATVQYKMPESASLPWHLIKQRTMSFATFFMLFLSGSMMMLVYYIPLWFQTTHGVEPVKSGVYTIPLVLSLVVASILSGVVTQKSGYYVPTMISGPCILLIAEGLLTTFTPQTGSPQWIGYQFLAGFGVGLGLQSSNLAVQATVDKNDVATGMAICFFAQQLGGAIFVSVGQTILSTILVSRLSNIPGLDPHKILSTGATDLHNVVPPQYFGHVVDAYNYAVTRIFIACLAVTAAQLLSSLGIEWKSIKKPAQAKAVDPEEQTEDKR
ncbi:Major facilitator superfamily domain, general substrate transporter [Cordyceps fumosorosea ARSEF 2679]|uniref:Major facilitator superfamily domain, general substrate transporter n=1 Tax=Cordyceps fumosorosea (strain ARSEF 2679) TaxID=1081104 RepID=A0A167U759_CORFA|nr:Major facilitator superfamily domain, general substrate transporter [Cordyceps fumosorosea ARSEF 2679]OAA61305.1 Major facilitator superfamily domain, general substrate transporter [Cordyceps fumosorosea ARSEF 2679]